MIKIIVMGLGVAGLAGLAIFGGLKKEENDLEKQILAEENLKTEEEKSLPKNFEEKTTLASIMSRGGNYKCTFSHKTDFSTSSGVVYINGKKVRGDFKSAVSIGSIGDIESHMISNGEFVYTWSPMSPQGFKAKATQNLQSDNTSVPTNQELDYVCDSWRADEEMFVIPKDITFVESK